MCLKKMAASAGYDALWSADANLFGHRSTTSKFNTAAPPKDNEVPGTIRFHLTLESQLRPNQNAG